MTKKIQKSKRNTKRILRIISIILILLVLVIVGFANYFLSKINYVSDDFGYQNEGDDSAGLFDEDGVLNILLTGSDSREGDSEGRSDVMILLSINKKTKTIVMTSIMRDLQMQIPGYGSSKLNAATVYGGHSLLMDTLYENLHINVEKYIAIDFFSFIDIIDAVGGVTVNIDSDEITWCNRNIRELNIIQGITADDGFITESGVQLLSGKQALGYARIRYVGNADYERTARQRIIVTAVINKMQEMNKVQLLTLLNVVLPELTTNLSKQDLITLIPIVLDAGSYDLTENRIPMEGENVHIVDYSEDIELFNQLVYGE